MTLTPFHLGFRGNLCTQFMPTHTSLQTLPEKYSKKEIQALIDSVEKTTDEITNEPTVTNCGCRQCNIVMLKILEMYGKA